MSFEGTTGEGIAPNSWSTCTEFSTPDTQPGVWEVELAPSDGISYLGLVTRGDLGPFANQNEDTESRMIAPLFKDEMYSFTVDLAHSTKFGHNVGFGGGFLAYDTPAKLQVYGGPVACDARELLWESPAINHTEWQTYVMNILPETVNVFYITFAAGFVGDTTYFGNVLVDNITECSIDLRLPTDTIICQRNPFVLDAFVDGANYLWQDGSMESSHRIDTTGIYTVDVSNHCVTKSFEIDVLARNCVCDTAIPIETMAFDTLICETMPFEIDASTPRGQYLWDDNTVSEKRTLDGPGTYWVEVTNGCDTELFDFTVATQSCDCVLEMPNVFTPNKDGINETFKITGTPGIVSFELQIFNRSGKLVFDSDSLSDEWTGIIGDSEAKAGVYYWIANLECTMGAEVSPRSFNGTITVLR